ncbi:DNA repair protein RecO [Sphingomonas sp. NSE70-1]|uniref:DNA repair protein RecO n=1 Tax=Sphingomonas caseinilyticus TaxID=2908205 RepID=A0ABT0RQS6_9SPHN|nr:DNA repair protein RecO [Sphingomonas caseinilyticus]MCL6697354.1 DNA repair protein RecO [Sphingomonas caseinilyticus]
MRFTTPAIIVALRPHGEHGAIVRLMTPDHGLQAAYVRGARGRQLRPVLMPGNQVEATLSARTEAQLAQGTIELVHSRGPLLQEPLPAAAIDWIAALTATVLPEGQPYPRLYQALDGLLAAIEAAPSASGWGAALVRYELLLLAELGFGLDLEKCAVSGANDELIAVSPRSGRAVSAAEAEPYAGKLLPLPRFVIEGGTANWPEILEGLALTGHFLLRDLVTDRSAPIAESRIRLFERLRKAAGQA